MPIQHTLDITPLPFTAPEFQAMPKARCVSCQEYVPLQLLSLHVKTCAKTKGNDGNKSDNDIIDLDHMVFDAENVVSTDVQSSSWLAHKVKSGYLKSLLMLVSGAEPTLSVPCLHPPILPTAHVLISAAGIMCPPATVPPKKGLSSGITCPPESRPSDSTMIIYSELFTEDDILTHASACGEKDTNEQQTDTFDDTDEQHDYNSWWLPSNGKASALSLLCLSAVCMGQELCLVSPSVTISCFSLVRINSVNLTIACVLSLLIRTEQEGYSYMGPINVDQKKAITDAVTLHGLLRLIPILNQLREELRLYGVDEVLGHHDQMCKQLFVPGFIQE
ncbi:uncharacterized protein LOC115587268 [Sparus aurata]|uniref:uncharacterized protein LOC115587268 n=1 Tax=Sparus aurata TaxID=8175 RepID=UPI0011C0FE4B|nr:uncharacterized protein LOC115587268 [Sparus aurata]